MSRILWAIAGVVLVSSLLYWVMSHPSHDEIERLSREYARLNEENVKLEEENDRLEETIAALRDDPRLAERRAREVSRLVRPDEIVYQFDQERGPDEVLVGLNVDLDGIELAGRRITLQDLPLRLEELPEELPGAVLLVAFEESLDPIARQRVRDIVAASDLDVRWETP